jgi:hypothetical protein
LKVTDNQQEFSHFLFPKIIPKKEKKREQSIDRQKSIEKRQATTFPLFVELSAPYMVFPPGTLLNYYHFVELDEKFDDAWFILLAYNNGRY